MKQFLSSRFLKCSAVALSLALSGCSGLLPKPGPQPTYYTLDAASPGPAPRAQRTALTADASQKRVAPTLVINAPRAASGFDSQRIIYVRQAYQLEYFAHSQWIDTPARMLAPLLVAAVEASGEFDAVLLSTTGASGDLRLDTEILRLQQDFGSQPSKVRFTLRAYLVDSTTRRVLARRDLEASVAAPSENPYGGVVAANAAVQSVLGQLASWCNATAAAWKSSYQAIPNPENPALKSSDETGQSPEPKRARIPYS